MENSTTETNITALPGSETRAASYRTPPHNFEAEMALLGAILANNRSYERVSEFLRPEHFADDRHARIYEVAGRLIDRGQIADPITLNAFFDQDTSLDDIGGAQYIARLATSAVSIINATDYAHTIHDLHLRRELIQLGDEVVNGAYSDDVDLLAISQIEIAEQKLYDLATKGHYEGGFQPFKSSLTEAVDMMQAAYRREGHVVGVSTGLADLDKKLGGLHPSDLVILAGRPSMGKTSLATNIAFNAARDFREEEDEDGKVRVVDGALVGFFSLEMSAEQLATRILSERSGVSSEKIRRGEIGTEDFDKVVLASQELETMPLFIDDTPALSVSALRTRARRLKRRRGLGLIVVDYLQLLRPTAGTRPENRVQEISDITRGLKTLAKELNVPVLALSQLSRAVEQREDKRPHLADLRESGSIEQDADVVMFVYREEYYEQQREPDPGTDAHFKWQEKMARVHNIAEIIIGKQRHGPIGTAKLYFHKNITKFENLVEDDRLPDDGL
ncbi:MAG: replicative DNA helicase [Alphaproteobacteria bacterium]|nr:replicative DNA helicase [Alphaproteobacteria bacterium]